MSNTSKLAKNNHIITLILRTGLEQMIHTEPILDMEINDGFMVITITPREIIDDKLVDASLKIYSYSNKYEYIFSTKQGYPIMLNGDHNEPNIPNNPKYVHLINIDVKKELKGTPGKLSCVEKTLNTKKARKCAIWTEENNQINDVVITLDGRAEGIRPENRDDPKIIMSGDQICKYRWVR